MPSERTLLVRMRITLSFFSKEVASVGQEILRYRLPMPANDPQCRKHSPLKVPQTKVEIFINIVSLGDALVRVLCATPPKEGCYRLDHYCGWH